MNRRFVLVEELISRKAVSFVNLAANYLKGIFYGF